MALIKLSQLITKTTAEQFLQMGLDIAETLGLPVTSWTTGDPTRTSFKFLAEALATLEDIAVLFVGSALLDYAEGDWLTVVADQVYNVQRVDATAATSTVTLSNPGANEFTAEVGDLTFYSSINGKFYRNTNEATLTPGGTQTFDVVADEPGSSSSAAVDEIDELVTGWIGVTVTASTAAIGVDEQSDESLREQCRDSTGALSPNGPADAYDFVVKNSELTGTTEITKSYTVADSNDGTVVCYLAGSSGPVTAGAVTAAADAVAAWAAGLCQTPDVQNATGVVIDITATVDIYAAVGLTESEVEDGIEDKIDELFAAIPIGGYEGELPTSLIISTIQSAFPDHIFKVTLSLPAADAVLVEGEVATIGTLTWTVNLT